MAYLKPQTPLKDLNSGDYFYPLTTIDQVQKSDGSRVQDYDLGNVALEDSETAPGPGTPQMTTLMNMVYPVGSIYMSVNATSPASLFGGTWEQIQDRFLLATGSTYNAGSTGGSATHTHTTPATTTGGTAITVAQMPSHHHIENIETGDGGIVPLVTNLTGGSVSSDFRQKQEGWKAGTPITTADSGYNQAHTHSQVATTTSATSTLPPYLAVYMWKRTA